MFPGGLTASSRYAGAEPLLTGRPRPYDESTLRRSVRALERAGGTEVVARHLNGQVATAVRASGVAATAHTDMYDQVYWTKELAHAAPIGGRGNRLLGAVYFGLTFVRVGGDNGPLLAYHVSWHKPASPLSDGVKDLHADPARHIWLTANIRLHTWDRGGNGVPLLQWATDQRIPYLTLANGSVYISAQRGSPAARTTTGIPVFVRRDVRQMVSSREAGVAVPRVVVFPARPDKVDGKRALRFPTNAALLDEELATVNVTYKVRWPDMENQIKALIAVGFGVNRDRTLKLTTSRGVDGAIERTIEREQKLMDDFNDATVPPVTAKKYARAIRAAVKAAKVRAERVELEGQPVSKSAREVGHGELLSKTLMLLMYNALAVLLAKSGLSAIRAMTPARVRDLLLGQPALASISGRRMTLWVETIADAEQSVLQGELVRLLNEHGRLRLEQWDTLDIRLVERGEVARR